MKYFIIIFYLFIISYQSVAQTPIDSLSKIREKLISKKNTIENEIEQVEKQIITDILQNGYEITLKGSYKNQTFDVKDLKTGVNTIITLKDGDKAIVIGKASIYFKVKIDSLEGKIFLTKPEYPIVLLNDYKYIDQIQGKTETKTKTTKTSSGLNCSSRQCSGRTQKGTTCHNMTTNCSGRCHLH